MSEDVLRDLARVKAIFQLRAIEAVIRGPQAMPVRPSAPASRQRQAV